MSWHLVTRRKRVKRLAIVILSCLEYPQCTQKFLLITRLNEYVLSFQIYSNFESVGFLRLYERKTRREFVLCMITLLQNIICLYIWLFQYMTKRCGFGILINNITYVEVKAFFFFTNKILNVISFLQFNTQLDRAI